MSKNRNKLRRARDPPQPSHLLQLTIIASKMPTLKRPRRPRVKSQRMRKNQLTLKFRRLQNQTRKSPKKPQPTLIKLILATEI